MVYEYKVKDLFKTPAQIAGEECERLENTPDGLTPKSLVDASRPKDAPLHNEFEWRDDVAAEMYREQQARHIICNLRIVPVESREESVTRAFVNVRSEQKPGTYHNLPTVMQNDTMREKLFESAKREMARFVQKYETLKEIETVINEMKQFI